MNKDNKESHSGETFAIIALIAALIAALLMLTSCGGTTAQTPEEKVYIEMSDGEKVELVADEYGNQYLKQYTSSGGFCIYTPYPGETDDGSDTLKFYNAKNQ
jgi:hypothetical protein